MSSFVPTIEVIDYIVEEEGSVEVFFGAYPSTADGILRIVISGIPSGWNVIGEGDYDPNLGTYTIYTTSGGYYEGGPILSPPNDSDLDLTGLILTVTETDAAGALVGEAAAAFDVSVDAVIDDNAVLNIAEASGLHGNALSVNILEMLTGEDVNAGGFADGSEKFTLLQLRVPAGFTLSAGILDEATGLYTLTQAELAGLTITPDDPNFSDSVTIDAIFQITDGTAGETDIDLSNNVTTVAESFTLTWHADTQPPVLDVNNGLADIQVYEDGTANVSLKASLSPAASANEYLTVVISVPAAAASYMNFLISEPGGEFGVDGEMFTLTYTLPAGVNMDTTLTFTPIENSDIDLNGLSIKAFSTNPATGMIAEVAQSLNVIVDAVADTPVIDISDQVGIQGDALNINLHSTITDNDGSELPQAYILTNVPTNFTVSGGIFVPYVGGGGSGYYAFLKESDLQGVTIKPKDPAFVGSIAITAGFQITELPVSDKDFDTTNNTKTGFDTFTLTWNAAPPPQPPELNVNYNNGGDAIVSEDGTVEIYINAALGTGAVASEVLTVTVSGISAGTLSAPIGNFDSEAGIWTVTLAPGQNLEETILVFTPKADSDVDLNGISVVAKTASPNGMIATTEGNFNIMVTAVADTPVVSVADMTGVEGDTLLLDIAGITGEAANAIANGTVVDGSEVLNGYTLSGVPTGFTVSGATPIGAGIYSILPDQIHNVKITPPAGFVESVDLTLKLSVIENATDGDFTDTYSASGTHTFTLTWTPPLFQPPVLDVNGGVFEVQASEDGVVVIPVSATLNSGATGTLVVSGIDPLLAEVFAPGMSFDPATGELSFVLPAGATIDTVLIITPKAHSDIDISSLKIEVTATNPATGETLTTAQDLKILVDAVIDDNAVLNIADVTGLEGSALAVNILEMLTGEDVNAGGLADGSEKFTLLQLRVPAGFTLSAGILDEATGLYTLTQAELAGLTITPDDPNFSDSVTIDAIFQITDGTAGETDIDLSNNVTTVAESFTLTWNAAPRAPEPSVEVTNHSVYEDSFVDVNITAQSSSVNGEMVIVFSGIPSGWNVSGTGAYNAGAGTYTVTVTGGADFTGGPRLYPPANSDFDLNNLTVTVTETDPSTGLSGVVTSSFNVVVDAVIDTPVLTAEDIIGQKGDALTLDITAMTGEAFQAAIGHFPDGSERIDSITLDIPTAFTLSAGIQTSPGHWELTQADLMDLKISAIDPDFPGPFTVFANITVSETNINGLESDLTNNSQTLSTQFIVTFLEPKMLVVGDNVDDVEGSAVHHVVSRTGSESGSILGNLGDDVLVGDVGGSILEPTTQDYNFVLILDVSGSMGSNSQETSRISIQSDAVKNLLTNMSLYQDGDIMIHIIPFATSANTSATFNLSDVGALDAISVYLDGLTGGGMTNYEDPLQNAIQWLQGDQPLGGNAITTTYFISDGKPNYYEDAKGKSVNGTVTKVMAEITGSDGSNEIELLKALSDKVIAVGIDIPKDIDKLNLIDTSGVAFNISDAADLSIILEATNPILKLADIGNDYIQGSAGSDIIFGDVLNTDELAAQHSLNLTEGAGFKVFEELEAGASAIDPAWSREDTIAYILTNSSKLSGESQDGQGETRNIGDDFITGDIDNDIIFGQEGNDTINGGVGSDILYGGTGADLFVYKDIEDGTDTIGDFNAAEGDRLDLASLLASYDPLQDSINDFVFATLTAEGDTIISVDESGSGDQMFAIEMAILEGVTTIDLNTAIKANNIAV